MAIDSAPQSERSIPQSARDIPVESGQLIRKIFVLITNLLELLPKSWGIGDSVNFVLNGPNK